MNVNATITPETEADFDGITRLHNLAFNQTEEENLLKDSEKLLTSFLISRWLPK
jgi:hypothetical protein